MSKLIVDIFAGENICGERVLLCSVNTDIAKNAVSIKYATIQNLLSLNLNDSQKMIIDNIRNLNILGNKNRELEDFDIDCMKRLVDIIDSHPDFDCVYENREYSNIFRESYDELAIVNKLDNTLVLKLTRDISYCIDSLYVVKPIPEVLDIYKNIANQSLDNGEIIDLFEPLIPIFKNAGIDIEFRTIDSDIIDYDLMEESNKIVIECSLSKEDYIESTEPLFTLYIKKLNGYYAVSGVKYMDNINQLINMKKINQDTANDIIKMELEWTMESFEDLRDSLIELFGMSESLLFDIIYDDSDEIITISGDDYYYYYDEDYEDEFDDEEPIEHETPIGFALMTGGEGFEELVAYGFESNGNLYTRICDNFISRYSDSNEEFENKMKELNNKKYDNIYTFRVDVEEVVNSLEDKLNYNIRLEVLLSDNVDITDFKKKMSITLINKHNNVSVARMCFTKGRIENQVYVHKHVTINGYGALDTDIRRVIGETISDYPNVENYNPNKVVNTIKSFTQTDDIEIIIIKDGRTMYVDKNTKIIPGSDIDSDYPKIYRPFDHKTGIISDNLEKIEIGKGTSKNKVKEEKLTFDDVVGMDDVKEKLYDVIDQFKNREKYREWGIKPIRGVLLHGPSGTGKSFISEALANEVDANFVKKSSGDIMSKYIGQSGQNIKRIFDEAREAKGNTIIFIDEIDAIASKRTDEENKERNATLNELLVQMSSSDNDNIFMIFATNLVELLDPAFLRSGRCDFKIEVPLPDFEMRRGILEKTAKKRPISDDVDFEKISRNMSGMNCADISHVSNEAARRALKLNKDEVEASDYEAAIEDMICGTNNKTTKLSDKEKTTTAYHEIGHFFMNYTLDLRKAKKISILPRGSALGFVFYSNEKENDKFLYTKTELIGQIQTLLAGRAMEDIFLDDISTGASDDLKKANKIARDIVCRYGFNDSLLVLDDNDVISRNKINNQVQEILNDCYNEVKSILKENKETVERLSKYLYDKEDVTGDELVDQIEKRVEMGI